jgi:hypothetical protein
MSLSELADYALTQTYPGSFTHIRRELELTPTCCMSLSELADYALTQT